MNEAEDWVAEVAGDARMLLASARVEDDEDVNVSLLCKRITGFAPWVTRSGSKVRQWNGNHRVCVSPLLPLPRARWVICHEIAEWHYLSTNYNEPDLEARCDALGAALVLPHALMRAAVKTHAHKVHRLASELGVPQALVMLRIGEIDRRPVLLERRPGVRLVRGAAFEWPEVTPINRRIAHPIRLPDEGRWGWMAA